MKAAVKSPKPLRTARVVVRGVSVECPSCGERVLVEDEDLHTDAAFAPAGVEPRQDGVCEIRGEIPQDMAIEIVRQLRARYGQTESTVQGEGDELPVRLRCRSMSVGDIAVDESGVAHYVAPCGFQKVELVGS